MGRSAGQQLHNLRSPAPAALEELVEPSNGLQESGLLGELDGSLGGIRTNSEAVLDVAVKGDLVWDGHILEDVFRLAALLRGEDLISLCCPVSIESNRRPQRQNTHQQQRWTEDQSKP